MSDEAPAQRAERWHVPAIDGSDGNGYLTAGALQDLQKAAYDEAWEKGREEGLAAGEVSIQERCARLDDLLRALNKPFDELDDSVESQLVELCMFVVKQLFRREIRANPEHVVGVVREAIQVLPIACQNVRVHLNPDDAALIRETLTSAENEPAWCIVEDPLMSLGGCRITTDTSQIDATAEARLHEVISRNLGDERN